MNIAFAVRDVLRARGSTQTWAVQAMNLIDPSLNMNRAKFSAIVCGDRKMSGDELIAFCKATETDPDRFFSLAVKE